jgi:hypothetical protein
MAGVSALLAVVLGLSHLLVHAAPQIAANLPLEHLTVTTAGLQTPQSLSGFIMTLALMTAYAFWRRTSQLQLARAEASELGPKVARLVRSNPLDHLIKNAKDLFNAGLTEIPLSLGAEKRHREQMDALGAQAVNGAA